MDQELRFTDGKFKNLQIGQTDKESVLGRAIVIHATTKDKTSIRVACGVIGRTEVFTEDIDD